MRHFLSLIFYLSLIFGLSSIANAHEVRPAFLEIIEKKVNTLVVTFKQPSIASLTVRLEPKISGGLLDAKPTSTSFGQGFQTRVWNGIKIGSTGLANREVKVEGLDRSITDALLIVNFKDGNQRQEVLKPAHQSIILDARGDALPIKTYLTLGVEHILTGYDHLIFVLALVLIVEGIGALLKTITAFTIAHSITLGASALGFVHFDAGKIEILVALSIAFVALELVYKKTGKFSIAQKWPWLIAFFFGLLHGTAFAGAVSEIGLPSKNIPLALFLFNVGVELGQLLFVAVLLALIPLIKRVSWRKFNIPQQVIQLAPAYAIGIAATFWVFERFHTAVF